MNWYWHAAEVAVFVIGISVLLEISKKEFDMFESTAAFFLVLFFAATWPLAATSFILSLFIDAPPK